MQWQPPMAPPLAPPAIPRPRRPWLPAAIIGAAIVIAAGLIGGTGQLLLTEAIRRAPVAVVAPFDYTQLVWAGLIGFLVWGETPAVLTLVGAMVVAASSTYILWREIGRSRA